MGALIIFYHIYNGAIGMNILRKTLTVTTENIDHKTLFFDFKFFLNRCPLLLRKIKLLREKS